MGRRGWSVDEVAAHLMERMPAIVGGLSRRTPWVGIDNETQHELYLAAATTVSQLAGFGRRRDWRTTRDLERATIAAFRHEALGHWKSVNAQKRRADRDALSFDPERDGGSDDPLDRLFESDPREETIARDWLAQLRGEVREFWAPVILEGAEYKEAGDRLGANKAQRQALYREGIEHLGRFRNMLEDGQICRLRATAIAAYRAGTADDVTTERARAHLDCCLPCALVHEAGASALKRGILKLFPFPVFDRALLWVRELPVGRAAETVGGAGGMLLLGKGTTAVICAGVVAAGVCVTEFGVLPNPFGQPDPPARHAPDDRRASRPAAPPLVAGSATLPPLSTTATTKTVAAPPTTTTTTTPASTKKNSSATKSVAEREKRATVREFDAETAALRSTKNAAAPTTPNTTQPTQAQLNEFDPETNGPSSGGQSNGTSSTGASSSSTEAATSRATSEFGGP